jgi:hypothetical protein
MRLLPLPGKSYGHVCGQLNSVRQARAQIVHKTDYIFTVAPANHVGHDQLAFAFQLGPGSRIHRGMSYKTCPLQ